MPAANQINDNKAHATFVFIGKVVKMKAATMPDIPVDNTLIVQIDHIIQAPAMFATITGHQVTVRFKELPQINEGATITVYANGWIFGETLAVDAVSYSTDTDKQSIASAVQATTTSATDDSIKERLSSAQLAVVGKVVKVEPSTIAQPQTLTGTQATGETATTHISEHDPDWHEATIQVDEVLKGEKNTKEVKVLFPKSDDVRWYNVHKYSEGQQGVWLLQQGKQQDQKGIPPKVFAAIPDNQNIFTTLHTYDYLPLNELGKIKSLINQ